ncbi:MAG: hypothetical protein HKP35_07240 [Silicimonas sp.]|nr:hypothetical protein [Silicimonas sp.]
MRRSLILPALLLAASPLYAASHVASDDSGTGSDATMSAADSSMEESMPKTMIAADAIEGAVIYSLGAAYDESLWDGNEPFGPVAADWAEIGEVEDLIISEDGQVAGVTVDVGGFLGLGERTVLVAIDDLRLVQSPDNAFFIVTRMQRAQMEEAKEVDNVIGD